MTIETLALRAVATEEVRRQNSSKTPKDVALGAYYVQIQVHFAND